ncbi:hypothetical protein ACIRU3_36865 [Streptomyces sp. NPDC101151]|uniref:hypothetical protein n=1 Tax=Streptomyces sp. NPDC101151 TaxID=3366115 RepID=UPI0038155F1E
MFTTVKKKAVTMAILVTLGGGATATTASATPHHAVEAASTIASAPSASTVISSPSAFTQPPLSHRAPATPAGQQLPAHGQEVQSAPNPWGTVAKFLKGTGLFKSLKQAVKNGRDAFLTRWYTVPNWIITKLHEWGVGADELFDWINGLRG